MDTDTDLVRTGSAMALQITTGKPVARLDEDMAEVDLLNALQKVQAAAKQKHSRTCRRS